MSIILTFVALFVIIWAAFGIKIVRQSETMVIERLGRYNRTLSSGINIIWPIIDRPREITWRYIKQDLTGRSIILKRNVGSIDLRENVYDFPKQSVITKDNVVTEINTIIYFQVTDPVKAVYEIANLPDAIASRISCGGLMSCSSTRLTFTPHLCVASSSTARSFELMVSREVRV